jgi:hypothetical protein
MGAVIRMVRESAIPLSREAGICRGQPGRAGERLIAPNAPLALWIGGARNSPCALRLKLASTLRPITLTLDSRQPRASIWLAPATRAQVPFSVPVFLPLIRHRMRTASARIGFSPSSSFRTYLTRQPRRPLFVPGSAEARVAVKAARFRAPVKNRRLCSSAPSGGPSARL